MNTMIKGQPGGTEITERERKLKEEI